MVDNLCSFIKRNPKLMHLDLSQTGLLESNLIQIARCIGHAASILAIHLSGNEITQAVLDKFRLRARARPTVQTSLQPFLDLPSEIDL